MIVENDRRAVLTHDFIVGHEYEVVVRAVGPDDTQQAMESAPRDTIVIQGKLSTPSVPTGLTAEGFLNVIVLAWTNPTDYDLKHVEIWRGVTGSQILSSKVAEVKGITYTDELGAADIERYYWIRAVNTSGRVSEYTARVNATTLGVAPTPIDDFSVTATKLFTNVVILDADSWSDNSPGAGSVAWNGHNIVYNGVLYPITAGNTASAYIYWAVGDATYTAVATHPTLGNTKFMIAINTSGIHTMVWNSSANMVIGSAWIADLAVIDAKINDLNVNKLTANAASTNEFVSNTAQIKNAIITDAKVVSLTVGKLTAGTIYSKDIVLAVTGGSGDCAIRAGKTDFTNAETGFIIGLDDSDSDLPKFYMGNTTKFMNWDGSGLTVQGLIQTVGGAGKRMVMDNSDNTFRFYDVGNNNLITMDDDLPEFGNNPGLLVDHVDGVVGTYDDANRWASMTPGLFRALQDTNVPCYYAIRDIDSGAGLGVVVAEIDGTHTGLLFDGRANSARVFGVTYEGKVDAKDSYFVNSTQVVGAQQGAIANPAGQADDLDSEARTAIDSILSALETHGLIDT